MVQNWIDGSKTNSRNGSRNCGSWIFHSSLRTRLRTSSVCVVFDIDELVGGIAPGVGSTMFGEQSRWDGNGRGQEWNGIK